MIIYRATGVINFAQGGLLAVGAYLTYAFANDAGLPSSSSCSLLAFSALLGAAIERTVLRKMVGQPVFAVIMIDRPAVHPRAGRHDGLGQPLNLADPWGVDTVRPATSSCRCATCGRSAWRPRCWPASLRFRLSKLGVAMRATALDPEAALAQGSRRGGCSPSRGRSRPRWRARGRDAGLRPAAPSPASGAIAPAFPAMIAGGLDSPIGAAGSGGIIIGSPRRSRPATRRTSSPWAGDNFGAVMPYLVMILILLVRPYGLFGTKEVRRV